MATRYTLRRPCGDLGIFASATEATIFGLLYLEGEWTVEAI